MRIAHMAYSLDIGGVELVSRGLVLGLSRAGHKCAVCALDRGGVLEEELKAADVDTRVIARRPNERIMPMWRISVFVRQFKPDIVHTHQSYVLAYSALPAKLAGVPIVHTEHETTSLQSQSAKRALLNLARFCRFVTGVSEEVTDFLRHEVGIPSRKLRTIPNGIDLDRFKRPFNRSFQMNDEEPVTLASVARLSAVKDHATLLRAFAIVHARLPHTRLILVGDGELRSELMALCDELGLCGTVLFLGARRDVEELLKEVDIYVLSSKSEGLPVALLEAMAVGSIVVSTRVGAVPGVIRHRDTGFLVDPEDPAALATLLEEVVRRLHELSHVSDAARQLIEKRYNFENTLSEYMALYQQALS